MEQESKSLVALASEIAMLEKEIMEAGGELTPELERLMDLTGGGIAEKVDKYRHVMDAFDTRAMFFKDIENQAYAGRKIFENHKDRLKDNLKYAMKLQGTTELCGNAFRFKLSVSKPKLVIVDEALIPAEYKKDKIVKVVDREAIENDLALGAEIPGVIVEPTDSIRGYVHGNSKPKQVKEAK